MKTEENREMRNKTERKRKIELVSDRSERKKCVHVGGRNEIFWKCYLSR